MKIAHFTSGFPVLSETFVLDEIDAFNRKGASNWVVSIRPVKENPSNPFSVEEALYGKPGITGILEVLKGPASIFGMREAPEEALRNLYLKLIVSGIIRRLREWGAEHCHAHFAHYPATLAWLCATRLGLGFSFNAHSYDLFHYQSFLREKVETATHIFPISEQNRQHLLSVTNLSDAEQKKIQTLHCGIDPARYPFAPDISRQGAAPLILAVGRLVDTKGFGTLIDSIPAVLHEIPNLRVEIIGEGPERENLESQIDRLELRERVSLLGALDRETTREKQANASLVVQPCCEGKNGLDGIPVVLMEAMALGTPVISTRFAGIPELIKDGETGLLVPPKDLATLSEAILESLGGSRKKLEMAQRARRKIEQEFNAPVNFHRKYEVIQGE